MKQSAEASTSESSITESSSEEVKNTLWDSEKSTQLATFVPQWGKTLGQEYKKLQSSEQCKVCMVRLYQVQLLMEIGKWQSMKHQLPYNGQKMELVMQISI